MIDKPSSLPQAVEILGFKRQAGDPTEPRGAVAASCKLSCNWSKSQVGENLELRVTLFFIPTR